MSHSYENTKLNKQCYDFIFIYELHKLANSYRESRFLIHSSNLRAKNRLTSFFPKEMLNYPLNNSETT